MDNRSSADSGKETPTRVSPNDRCSLCFAFFVKEGNCRSRAHERVVEGAGRIFDEVGVFQRAGRRDGELDGLSIVYFLEVKENEVK